MSTLQYNKKGRAKNYKTALREAADLINKWGPEAKEDIIDSISRYSLNKNDLEHLWKVVQRYYTLFLIRS
jgi:hypothetical protein